MKIRITSVAEEAAGAWLNDVTVWLEDRLNPLFNDKSFGAGIEQFVVVFIAVESDPELNKRFVGRHDSSGRYKNPFTKEWVKYISFALLLNPDEVVHYTADKLKLKALDMIRKRLQEPGVKISKEFDYKAFTEYMDEALVILEISVKNQ